MAKLFIIFSQLREEIKNSESQIPLAPPQKQAGKGIVTIPRNGVTNNARTGSRKISVGGMSKPVRMSSGDGGHCQPCNDTNNTPGC
jgi:hypothetical protein